MSETLFYQNPRYKPPASVVGEGSFRSHFLFGSKRTLLLAAPDPPNWEGSDVFMGRVFSKKTRPYFEHEIRTNLRDLKSVLVYYLTPLQKQECVVLEHTVYLQRGGGPSINGPLSLFFCVFIFYCFFRFFIFYCFFLFLFFYFNIQLDFIMTKTTSDKIRSILLDPFLVIEWT